MSAIAALADSAGILRISLSVERKNFAQKLYLSEGYQVVDSSDANSDTMVKDLTAVSGPATRYLTKCLNPPLRVSPPRP